MDLKAIFAQVSTLYKNLNKKQRIVILATATVLVGFLSYLLVYSFSTKATSGAKPGYGVLFEGVKPQDSALIIQNLQQNNIPYQLPREDTILIPKEKIYEERIALASQGIPKNSTVGFEIFDTKDFGATSFESKVKLLRAIEGELARTIESLTPIQSANVLIAIPKESVFVSKQTPPTASVMLVVNPNMRLTQSQIMGIKNLVAAAVAKLVPENVKLVDENGEPLGESTEANSRREKAANELKYKHNFELTLEKKIVSILSPIVGGDDKVVAKVNADFDFSEQESTKETFDPNNVVRSEQNMEEKREGLAPKQIGGVPGVVSNIGPVQGLNNDGKEKYQKTQNTTNYEVGKTISQIKSEFGRLTHLSAAVVVDGKYKIDKKDGKDEMVYIPLPKKQLATIEALVRQSIGFNAKRGDKVAVSNFEFNGRSGEYKPMSSVDRFTSIAEKILHPVMPLIKYLIIALVLIYFYKRVIAPFTERMLEVSTVDDEGVESLFDFGDEDELEDRITDVKKRVEDQLGLGHGVSEDEIRYDILLDKVRELVQEKPEEVAQLFEALIYDEQSIGT